MYLFRMCVWVSVLKWRLYVSTYCACLIKCVCVCAIRTFFRKILILHMLTRNSSWNFHLFTCSHATSRSTKTGTWAPSPGDSALVLTLRSSNEAGMKNQSLAKRPTKPSHMMSPSWTLYQFSCVNCCQSLWKIWTSEGSWEQRIKIRKTRFGIPCAQTMKLFQGGSFASWEASETPIIQGAILGCVPLAQRVAWSAIFWTLNVRTSYPDMPIHQKKRLQGLISALIWTFAVSSKHLF